jgi:hypothetical protein
LGFARRGVWLGFGGQPSAWPFLGVGIAALVCYGVLIFVVIQPDWRFSVAFWIFQALLALVFMAWAFTTGNARNI